MATFENLQIKRMIAHEVVTAKSLTLLGPGVMSTQLLSLEETGMKLVSNRLAEVLGRNSHSVEVEVERSDPNSTFAKMTCLLEANDADFIAVSKQLAQSLSQVQVVGSIKGGIAVLIEATAGPEAAQQRLIIIVKAESDPAFIKEATDGRVSLKYVHEMVFGPQQRLFKIGAFVEEQPLDTRSPGGPRSPRDFTVIVYDHGMSIKDVSVPAKYFYSAFLGTTTSPSAPALNKRFFEAASAFINHSNRGMEERWLLRTSLISYFQSQEGTISTRTFGERYLREDERSAFRQVLSEAGVPPRAIEKDSRFIKDRLRFRKLVFSSRVSLTAPADGFNDLVKVERSTDDATTIRIAGKIETDE